MTDNPMADAENLQSLRWRWWALFYSRCLTGFPWFWPSRPLGVQAMVEARRLVRQHFGRDHHPAYRLLARMLTTIAWPLAVLVHLWQMRRHRGPTAVPIKKVPQALWAAMRHNILPGEYYAYALWQPDRRRNIDNYLYSNEAPRLFKLLNRPYKSDPIDDKLAFHDMCKANAVPSPAILAAFAPTGCLTEFHSGQPPEHDLFVKPRTGFGGEGVERLRWHGRSFESNRGCRLRPKDLGAYLVSRARIDNRTLLVQPMLLNHPDLQTKPNEALATARLVTGLSIDGDVIPLFGFIYFARAGRITAQHGYVALIDVADGRLISAPLRDSPATTIYQHPQIELESSPMLPDWAAALGHAKNAHRACPNFVFVGWDVAFTEHGPMILEGNANWCADEYQALRGEPLGCTRFADILSTRLSDLQNRQ